MPASRSISRSSSTNGNAQLLRERAAERRLAGAAQADQRDPLLARRLLVAEIAHQAEHDVLEPMLGQAVEKAPDQALLDRVLARIEQLGHAACPARARRCATGAPTRCLRRPRVARDSARRRRRFCDRPLRAMPRRSRASRTWRPIAARKSASSAWEAESPAAATSRDSAAVIDMGRGGGRQEI